MSVTEKRSRQQNTNCQSPISPLTLGGWLAPKWELLKMNTISNWTEWHHAKKHYIFSLYHGSPNDSVLTKKCKQKQKGRILPGLIWPYRLGLVVLWCTTKRSIAIQCRDVPKLPGESVQYCTNWADVKDIDVSGVKHWKLWRFSKQRVRYHFMARLVGKSCTYPNWLHTHA